MNKEQLVKGLKYTKEKHKNDKLYTFDTDISAMCSDVLDVLSRCVEIPDNTTNGDVIKAIFGYKRIRHFNDNPPLVDVYGLDNNDDTDSVTFYEDWWNAPYK